MEYKQLGSTGIKVSEICLGTMTFGRETDKKTSQEMISQFLDKGGNFIDTADVYGARPGNSEEIVGEALKGKRKKVILATKAYFPTGRDPNDTGLSRVHLIQALENSLHRLQTDYIDLYYVHCWDGVTSLEETLSTLNTFVKQGKVRYIGASNFTAWQLMKALGISRHYSWEEFICFQIQYNLLTRGVEREIIPLCREEKLAVVAWSPLAGGFLSGKYHRNSLPTEGRLARMRKEDTDSWQNRATEKNFRILEVVEKIAREKGKSCAQIALAWIRYQPGIIAPLIGARTLEQFEDNLGSLEVELTADELRALNEVSRPEDEYPYSFIRRLSRNYPY
ncbi:aldo/keto reductase [Candidatus Aerophobetes bacterium]|nr:aldo/keto reductase [Candidatus Aerophobetes bacterium]